MIKADKYFIENLTEILENGTNDENPRPRYKDGEPAYTKFITQVFETYDISKEEFPITTLRNTAIKTGIKEIFWIYQLQSNVLEDAHKLDIRWWDDFNIGDGTIGHRYGATVKKYNLMNRLLDGLKDDPFGRRHSIDMYQYADLQETKGLYPCAFRTDWSVRKVDGEYYLDVLLSQRSNDYIIAGNINKIQYVALLMMVASHLGYKVGKFSHITNNLHIYDRHVCAAKEILEREAIEIQPKIKLKEYKNFYDFTVDDFIIENIDGIKKISSELELAI